MSYQDVMNTILPHQQNHAAHITGHYGEVRTKGPHGGSDMNYDGGQAGINLTHPGVHSPVSGEVTFVGGQYGTIKVRDAQGNSHEILHTATQSVTVGHHVNVGDEIGTMGGRGPHGVTQYAQHVHYQMKDNQGRLINPETYWNEHVVDIASSTSSTERTASASSPASSHHVLKQSDQSHAVHDMQANLADLGYKDGHGQPLKADGDFGSATQAAVEAFQRDHHLKVDGKAGPKTLEALHTQTQSHAKLAPGLDDPKNPDHALYEQALAGVRKLDTQAGRASDQHSANLAAALVVDAKKEGLTRIDNVVLSTDGGTRVFAVQNGMPLQKFAEVPTLPSLNTPIDKSSAAVQQLNQQQAPVLPQMPAPVQSAPAMSR